MAFNGQKITLGRFSNLYENTVYANNGDFTEISTYYCGISF